MDEYHNPYALPYGGGSVYYPRQGAQNLDQISTTTHHRDVEEVSEQSAEANHSGFTMYPSEVTDHRQDYRGQAVSTFNTV
jgi:hypothetical protein